MYVLAERIIQGENVARVAIEKSINYIWAQDPWIAWSCNRYLIKHSKNKFCVGVSIHTFGASSLGVLHEGLNLPDAIISQLVNFEAQILKTMHWVLLPSRASLLLLTRDLRLSAPHDHWSALPYGRPIQKPCQRKDARIHLAWQDDVSYVLAVGRIQPIKRMEAIVRACAMAENASAQKVQLVILCGTAPNDLVELARSVGLKRPINALFIHDVQTYLCATDVYMSACQHESFGLANQEAITAGIPGILSSGVATNEMAGFGAWMTDGSVESLAHCLLSILENTCVAQFWRNQALEQSRNWLSWKDFLNDFEARIAAIPAPTLADAPAT